MKSLDRKLLRDLWRIKGQIAAIMVVIACGVAALVMSFGTLQSLRETRAAYYERYRFADLFAPVKRAPEALGAGIARIVGVNRFATRIVKDVTLDLPGVAEPAIGRLVSVPEDTRPLLNDVVILSGRYIRRANPDETLISESLARAHGLGPGDTIAAIINGRKRALRIVGVALSPEFIYAIGPGVLIPDDRRFGILWMGRKALAAAFDLDRAFNSVTLTLERGASPVKVIDRLDALLEPYGGVGAYARDDQLSHAFIAEEMNQLSTMGTILPPIFLGVAIFLLNIVVARLIETERGQIGLLKAFGYSDFAVGFYYLRFALIVAVAGLLLGFAGGAWLGRATTEMYTEFFHFPFLQYTPNPAVFVVAAVTVVAATAIGTLGAVRRAAALPPAVAMAPATPVVYGETLFERLAFIRRMSESNRMIFRHIGRWPTRAALTVFGVATSVALMVGSLFFFDAINHSIDVFFDRTQRQDVAISFVEPRARRVAGAAAHLPGVIAVEPVRVVAARIRYRHRSERIVITGLSPDADIRRALDIGLRSVALPRHGLVLSTKLAEMIGAHRGDRVIVEVLEGRRPVREIPVAGLVEEYFGTPAYMDIAALNRLMGEGPTVSGVSLLVDSNQSAALYRRLKDTPAIAGVTLRAAALQTFRETMAETIYIMLAFYIFFGASIAVGVVLQ